MFPIYVRAIRNIMVSNLGHSKTAGRSLLLRQSWPHFPSVTSAKFVSISVGPFDGTCLSKHYLFQLVKKINKEMKIHFAPLISYRRAIWHLTVPCTSNAVNRHSRNLFSQIRCKSTGHFQTRLEFSLLTVLGRTCWTKHILRRLDPFKGWPYSIR